MALPCDLGEVLVDGVAHVFVAHLVARKSWLRGPIHLVMNAEFLGDWDVAPRSHPNDGRLEHLHVTMRPAQRLEARRRARSGAHLPHPDISLRRVASAEIELEPGTSVWLDGTRIGTASRLSVRCRPDALTVHI